MRLKALHSWELDFEEAVRLQERLAPLVSLRRLGRRPGTACGLDVSSSRGSRTIYAAAVVMSLPGFEVIEAARLVIEARFPYVPGLLSFREAPALLECLGRLRARPDVIVVDGQGLAHPRRMGLACHVGLWANTPTVGCAKSILVGSHGRLGRARGSRAELIHRGETVGYALRTRAGVKPVYVSAGHLVTLDDAVRVTLELAPRFRLTEPVRAAHALVNSMRREAEGGEP